MRLTVTTPTALVLERDGIRHVRGEDDTGAFGILPRHADFLTALAISVLSWRDDDGREGHVAVRGGVLRVSDGERVQVATREAVAGDDLESLEDNVIRRFHGEDEAERQAHGASARMELAVLHHLRRYLHPDDERVHHIGRSVNARRRRSAGTAP